VHSTICDFISDLAQNSVEAGATAIIIDLNQQDDRLEVIVSDNGKGMDEETLKKAVDPFYTEEGKHARRKVGLGLPFLKQAVEQTSGIFEIKSEKDLGTSVWFTFDLSNVDAPPVGNIRSTVVSLMNFPGPFELVFNREQDGRKYSLSRDELWATLGELESADSLILTEKYVSSLEEEIMNQR
jgi:hypothetical protein